MKQTSFYITTTLPYVNSDPHIGFAMEIIRADVIARYKKLMGYDVFFNTGTDEHGIKVYIKALEAEMDPKAYVDRYAEKFFSLKRTLNLSDDLNFIRTTDEHHTRAAQEFWRICKKNGHIYKKNYQAKYCTGCELEKTDSELNDQGRCLIHPNRELELIDEENYFFKFSDFQKKLLDFYEKTPDFVIPDFRYNEIKSFVSRGLSDFSISRLKSKMPWGVEVPDDQDHVMYVWFDALVNYISCLGWPDEIEKFKKYWERGTPVQYCGKDNLRQQAAMWQAMLMAAGLPNSRHIVIDGFINVAGHKMSKSAGNMIDPFQLVEEYGADAIRYFLTRELSPFEDSDYTPNRLQDTYNANLANGLGNLTSRIMQMAETNLSEPVDLNLDWYFDPAYINSLNNFNLLMATDRIWDAIKHLDEYIQLKQPFKIIKTDSEEGSKQITYLVKELYRVGLMLEPFMPETSQKIRSLIKSNRKPDQPLFLRKE